MLTAFGQKGDAGHCREESVAVYLTKPVRRAELRGALIEALREPSLLAPEKTVAPAKTPPAASYSPCQEASSCPLRILLAEDNLVNQALARKLLQKRGHTVAVANSGREAMDLLDQQLFDLVLMDVQMPEMDGFEATAALRAKEKRTGRHLPVIAMTAHAMKGDEERCLKAGMDGYVAKPVAPTALYAAIEAAYAGRVATRQ